MNNRLKTEKEEKHSQYLSIAPYQGKDKLYNIMKINTEQIDTELISLINSKIREFYDTNLDKQLGGNENNVLNLSQVECLKAESLHTILLFNKLNKERYDGKNITIITNQQKTKQLLEMSKINSLVEVIENIYDL